MTVNLNNYAFESWKLHDYYLVYYVLFSMFKMCIVLTINWYLIFTIHAYIYLATSKSVGKIHARKIKLKNYALLFNYFIKITFFLLSNKLDIKTARANDVAKSSIECSASINHVT